MKVELNQVELSLTWGLGTLWKQVGKSIVPIPKNMFIG